MIPKECKRLAEVDFPIAVVSKHAVAENAIRHGHPKNLHLWWARRPLAACRAMLLALLLPDPCDEHCPGDFKKKARELLPKVQGQVGAKEEDLRKALLKFIGDFANWGLSANGAYLEVSHGLLEAAHLEDTPLVVDPFAGGGSISFEALRLGCETFASDLNPVACLLLRVLLEDIPRHGLPLAEELKRVGKQIGQAMRQDLEQFYPEEPDGSTTVGYLWARTARCEQPNCGAEIPLVRSFWLCKKDHRKIALRYKIVSAGKEPPYLEFQIFEPKRESEVPAGTVSRAKAACPSCNMVLSRERVRAQLISQNGGADVAFNSKGKRIAGAKLLAVATVEEGESGRRYRLAEERDYEIVYRATEHATKLAGVSLSNGLTPVPDELVDEWHHDVNRMPMYGMRRWGDLFTARQKIALLTLSGYVGRQENENLKVILGLLLDRCIDFWVSLARWKADAECPVQALARQALPLVWDFAEPNPLSESTGSFLNQVERMSHAIEASYFPALRLGQSQQADACNPSLPDDSAHIWFTDPPYYDAIDYAHCSDFFFVWLKRALLGHALLRDPADPTNPLTPKKNEIVVDSTTTKGHGVRTPEFYERLMTEAFSRGYHVLKKDGMGCVVFAHKTTEGWEALLSGMIQGGWLITASWPIATELGTRLRARESAALATSVHLVCRPRPENAPVGDWGEVLRELPNRVGDWMERLQSEGIRGADLVFACIGPALEIFSRYSKVETAEGKEVTLAEYLEKVWEVVGRTALEHVLGTAEARARNSMAGALEEDARLTALFLWTLQSTNGKQAEGERREAREEESEEDEDEEEETKGKSKKTKGFSLVFDVVRRFAQPLGIHLEDWEGRIIETEKGIVRLLSVTERAKQLFGEDGAEVVADELERSPERVAQLMLFPDRAEGAVPEIKVKGQRQKAKVKGGAKIKTTHEATTLDRVHAAMLLQASGRTNALRALLKAEQERSPDFLRLANALSALYPRGSEEKRLLDAMLLAVPK